MNNSGITAALNTLYDHLPMHAEEGGEAFSVNIRDCIKSSGADKPETLIAADLVEQLFISLGLLDETLLEHGIWRFKSFPASLMARSVMLSLKNQNQSIFPKGFWGVQNDHSGAVEDQRNVLDYLENQRHKNHSNAAQPIRYVHVAWGLICVDGKFLMRHREDKNRENESNYVLVGGKVSQNDLMVADQNLSAQDAVRLLQSPNGSNNLEGIKVALDREMSEETGLQQNEHYTYSNWRTLKPYTNVGGAGAARAVTEYHIHVYHIKLNQDGLLALSKKVRSDENLVWFTAEELVNAKTQDGKMAYIPALIEDFDSSKEWKNAMNEFPPSFDPSVSSTLGKQSLLMSISPERPVLLGARGKEKRIACDLNPEEHGLLLSLCLYAKGEVEQQNGENSNLLDYGWIEIIDPSLRESYSRLAKKLQEAGCPLIDGYKEQFFRIALPTEMVCFEYEAFRYRFTEVEEGKYEMKVTRDAVSNNFLSSDAVHYIREVNYAFYAFISELEKGEILLADKSVDTDRDKEIVNIKQQIKRLKPWNQSIGLATLVREVVSKFKLAVTAE